MNAGVDRLPVALPLVRHLVDSHPLPRRLLSFTLSRKRRLVDRRTLGVEPIPLRFPISLQTIPSVSYRAPMVTGAP